ncbi:MAG: hypothetical protein UU08_C0008G0025 [Candidatus Uhrbacteria bacterium GW2011_GWE2_40_58]|nr:MAG: hypothetical protein UT94_C0008G0025 [Candidatus Uhrbacteria bacterium GW2011_GWF2_40_263]KKR67819.1 MAG: hypothetical protein UU08_C0008G0025 [Candidatus Uhrbacteria bacterium GW2011_GWE2_40_58]
MNKAKKEPKENKGQNDTKKNDVEYWHKRKIKN